MTHPRDQVLTYTKVGRGMAAVAAVVLCAGGCVRPVAPAKPVDPAEAGASAVEEVVSVPTHELLGIEAPEEESEATQGDAPEPVQAQGDADAPAQELAEDAYRIGAGDILEFRSFDDSNLSQELVVRYDGHVSLPLIPDVKIGGLTRDGAIEEIEEAYLEVFKNPQVSLTIREAQSKLFYVYGDVMRPSQYEYTQPLTVIEAINRAGGKRVSGRYEDDTASQQGTLTKAFIIRGRAEERDVIECDLRDMTHPGAHPSDTLVLPRDIVLVPEGMNLVYVLGEVGRAQVFQLAEGQTFIQLLARAGSTRASTARMRHVLLLRAVSEDETQVSKINMRKILRTGEDIVLEPGDIIYVPRRPLVRLNEWVNRLTGTISPVLNLYNLAWETKYTEDRLEQLFDQDVDDNELLNLLQQSRSYGELIQGYQSSLPLAPAVPGTP